MIQTNKFNLTQAQYFRIILGNYLRRRVWVPCILALGFLFGIIEKDYLLIILLPILFISIIIYNWYYAYCKQNSIFFKDIYFELDGDFLTGYFDDGTTSKINIKNIIKLRKSKKYFLLYIAKDQYVYLPFACFKSEADLRDFEKKIIQDVGGI